MEVSGRAPGQWTKHCKDVKGVLLDISGVLYDSGPGGGVPIDGSVDAVKRLKKSGVPVRFCTNETQTSTAGIIAKLTKLGFDVQPGEVFAPAPAVRNILIEKQLRPLLLVHPDVLPEFSDVDKTSPNCVVLGDAATGFSFENMNEAFQALMKMKEPKLISMGRGKYYKNTTGLVLDVGPFMKALEYACDVTAQVVGKPSRDFFLAAVKDMGAKPETVLMIGDDIVNDVGGAQACGLLGVQVRTGKFRPGDERHATVKPDGYVNNLMHAVQMFLQHRK